MDIEDIREKVMKPIIKKGFNVYFVGGCVRDALKGWIPHDYDLCTDATPEDLHKVFKDFSDQNSEPFGVTMPIINGQLFEIATMRKDITKGRHPTITFTKDIKEDAMRRDFTVNALYCDIDGNVIDPTGLGKSDIESNVLRFVGNAIERIDEDPLRLFRFCRFMAQKGFKNGLTPRDVHDIQQHIQTIGAAEFFKDVSKERKLKEFMGIFSGRYFMTSNDATMMFMDSFGIFEAMGLKDMIDGMKATNQNPRWHSEGDVFAHTLLVMKEMAKTYTGVGKTSEEDEYMPIYDHHAYDHMSVRLTLDDVPEHERFILMAAAFFHDMGKPISAARKEKKHPEDDFYRTIDHDITGAEAFPALGRKMGLCNEDIRALTYLIRYHMDAHTMSGHSNFKITQLRKDGDFNRLVKLCYCDEHGCIKNDPDGKDEETAILEALEESRIKELLSKPIPEPVLTGDYLIERGYKPSEKFARALEIAYKVQLNQGTTDLNILFQNAKVALV